MRRRFSIRGAGLVFLTLLVLFMVRPQVPRLRARVANSLSTELNRPVEIGVVQIRFLPRPELELEDLEIHDSGPFGAEPLLRSPDVTAWLRVSSLLRGRIEIAGLSLSDASLNLTRDQQGKWSLSELVERTARSSTAPTASGHRETRAEFPYIEANHTRINFKNGLEKTRFALTDADFALWQQSENEWGMRLRARPMRTDSNLTDTGVIDISGVWQRSVLLENTPLQFALQWKQAQIGQVSRLIYGIDKGWRGNVLLSSTIAGTPRNLRITTDALVDDFRRFDILSHGDLQLGAHCGAEFDSIEQILSNVDCIAPAGDGSLELKGSVAGIPYSSYVLNLVAAHIPAQSALALARHLSRHIPEDLTAAGNVNLALSYARSHPKEGNRLIGHGEAQGLLLRSQNTELALGDVPFVLVSENEPARGAPVSEALNHLQVGPFSVEMGRPAPLEAELLFSRTGFQGRVQGEAGVKRLLQAARILHIPAPEVSAEGTSAVNLSISGAWDGTMPLVTGSAQLRTVHAQVHGLNAPLQIRRADLVLDTNTVKVKDLEASAGETNWRGSMLIPRPCGIADSCSLQFHLRSPQISAAALNQLFNPMASKRPWYKFFTSGRSPHSYFLNASAKGKIEIGRLVLHGAACERFSVDVELEKGKLTLAHMRGDLFGGHAFGDWKADFSVRPPVYAGNGSFEETSLPEVADLMHNNWIDGSGSATYRFNASGWTFPDLLDSAELGASFKATNALFRHIVLSPKSTPLAANTFSGRISLHNGDFSLEDAKLETSAGVYKVSGSASIAGGLNLKMTSEALSSYSLSGNLLQTRVSPLASSATRAALKP